MEEKAITGQVIIVLTEHLTFGTLLIPYMAEQSDDGTWQLIEQALSLIHISEPTRPY